MNYVLCPYCGSDDHVSGYGLAAGPMGSYTFCNTCDQLISFRADYEGLPEDRIVKLKGMQASLDKTLADARMKQLQETSK